MSVDDKIATHVKEYEHVKRDDDSNLMNLSRWWHKAKKACIFAVVDILMTYLFVYIWYKYVEKREDAFHESSTFTFWMEVYFMFYYYTFDFSYVHLRDAFNI